MPLFKTIKHNATTSIFIWKIDESLQELSKKIELSVHSTKRLLSMKSELHKRGFMSVRHLLKNAGYIDTDLYYNDNGKPHLKDEKHISITHSYHFSAIIISDVEVGIDIEKNREKIKTIQNKFVNFERGFLHPSDDLIEQLTVVWGAKESLYKIYPFGGLTFKNDIDIDSFKMENKKTSGTIKVKNWHKNYAVFFEQIDGFTLVYALEQQKK